MLPGEQVPENLPPVPDGSEAAAPDLSWVAEDPVLKEQALAAAAVMGVDMVQDLIISHSRFPQSAIVEDADGNEVTAPHYMLGLILEVMPDYMANARAAGLDPAQAYDLVRTILTDERRSMYGQLDGAAVQLSRAFRTHAERNHPIDAADYATLHALVVDVAARESDSLSAIDTHRALTRLDFAVSESDALIRNHLFTDSLVMDYALRAFNALSVAKVDTAVLTDICRLIPGEDPQLYEIQGSYQMLYSLITIVCPERDMSPSELLKAVRDGLANGSTMADITEHFIANKNQQIEGGDGIYQPAERRDRHFITATGPLELSLLPYRNERSLQAGAADIGRIATAVSRYREPVGEGFWIFDRDAGTPTWYSLGAETDVDPENKTVTAAYPPYPLGDLSRNPVLYHAHPADLEWVISPRKGSAGLPNAAVKTVSRFLAATPSRRDYAMVADLMRSPEYKGGDIRSLIAHGSGATEYIYPHDPDALEEMGRMAKALRDDLLIGIDWERILYARKWLGMRQGDRKGVDQVVQELVERFSAKLPKGFSLRMFGINEPIEP